ncbi:hypothetical protein [Rhodoferax sp.]|jgi:hypothetical protein|uniref:hypothetical protein n=1 Tax=Rhodoferax sp. TaxID=50421 RepID=UPI0025F217F7|nr:hypothetical protein [Rhodoferax sp.]MCM2296264.1 hypothetical protein [Rhodoferax sp.]
MKSRSAKQSIEKADAQPANIDNLHDWRCFELLQAGSTERTHHIVGSICRVQDGHDARQGCVTSALVSVDPDSRTVLTENGTVYRLRHCSDITPDAFYIWRRWQRATQATNVVDVTSDINAVLAPSPSLPVA